MTVDRPNSTPTGDASSQKGEDREHPQPTARVENRPSSDRQREALPPGELRAPNKYGVSDDKLPDRVGRLTKTARDYGETADELSGKAAKELRSAETLRDQWR